MLYANRRWEFVLRTVLGCALAMISMARSARAQSNGDGAQSTAWATAAIAHAQQMKIFADLDHGSQAAPRTIPQSQDFNDPAGIIETDQINGATQTRSNPFFQNLGTNGRTCFTCHQPHTGWTISAASAKARFERSQGRDPLFRRVDGATCPIDKLATLADKRTAYQLLTSKGLIRIGLAMPPGTQFEVTAVSDPYNCNTNPVTGLTSPTTGIVSVYRRPLPSTNLPFLSAFMWDGREPSLAHQALDATLGHAQAKGVGLTPEQQQEIVAFETGLYTAQIYDRDAHLLLASPSTLRMSAPIPGSDPIQCAPIDVLQTGGPIALQQLTAAFFVGINDPLGLNPCGTDFSSQIFNLYRSWETLPGDDDETEHRLSVARGEELFNTKPITITGVAGLNDVVGKNEIAGTCGTCHDTPNVGNHSIGQPLNIGIGNANPGPPALDIAGLPVFALHCTAGPLAGQDFHVTDPGRALITGDCVDIGKLKGPILRGLAARAPYFHNGSAATLMDAVNFYDQRFAIGFSAQEKQDLANFLATL